jgi:hypothetical protein
MMYIVQISCFFGIDSDNFEIMISSFIVRIFFFYS